MSEEINSFKPSSLTGRQFSTQCYLKLTIIDVNLFPSEGKDENKHDLFIQFKYNGKDYQTSVVYGAGRQSRFN